MGEIFKEMGMIFMPNLPSKITKDSIPSTKIKSNIRNKSQFKTITKVGNKLSINTIKINKYINNGVKEYVNGK